MLIRALRNRPLLFCTLGRLCCGCNFALLIRFKGKAILSVLSTPDCTCSCSQRSQVGEPAQILQAVVFPVQVFVGARLLAWDEKTEWEADYELEPRCALLMQTWASLAHLV